MGKAKIGVCPWGLSNPVLIVVAKTGVVYFNQVGGCGCLPREQEGYLVPLPVVNPMDCLAFNHYLWYDRAHSAKVIPSKLNRKPGKKLVARMKVANRAAFGAKTDVTVAEYLRINYTGETDMWFTDVIEGIEQLSEENRHWPNMRVIRSVPQIEAWFSVRVWIAKKPIEAILTWQNSG